jgi:hypothetical protein
MKHEWDARSNGRIGHQDPPQPDRNRDADIVRCGYVNGRSLSPLHNGKAPAYDHVIIVLYTVASKVK